MSRGKTVRVERKKSMLVWSTFLNAFGASVNEHTIDMQMLTIVSAVALYGFVWVYEGSLLISFYIIFLNATFYIHLVKHLLYKSVSYLSLVSLYISFFYVYVELCTSLWWIWRQNSDTQVRKTRIIQGKKCGNNISI